MQRASSFRHHQPRSKSAQRLHGGFQATKRLRGDAATRKHRSELEAERQLAKARAKLDRRHPFYGKKKKVAAYIIYLVVFLGASLIARPTQLMFNQNSLVENALGLAPEGSGDSHLLPFSQLESPAHWWGFMRSTFVPGILSPDFDPGHDNRALELITGPRIRQVRVRSAACSDEVFVRPAGSRCFPPFAEGEMATEPFGPGWNWTAAEETIGYDKELHSQFGPYSLSGYIVPNISTSVPEFNAVLTQLEADGWIDAQTRAVIVDVRH